ncbi:FAD-binding oxidoreductase [Marinobacter lutaoensis]|jgi:glycolate oxidase subunit GlcD|uniref:D-2-hydroxyglutarate dehydrogenase n=1 Tax=Marinobacter lutaoensis TaxID=135739 RepID=A0A1V2DRC5_9GAMM|nr:FAD-binding oxidoreductase [Marinobacter lutaoensis]MBE03396.1 FAD-binding oxidoreductase [Marinobacter sp.]MBI43498.1 FAD-binding oxidoreductase [Oceanospirillales bacterium]NVD36090.1 FAD-binding oxidoreductase [Marinobacter lutaoensis]ONF42946.1 FAD-binding oxidoreductase [Marinobacter lutaoensis]|tara:strand:- start:667 stop:2070 length:1404 start_codon:yes stop_codon:yes gene_type:complete
MNSEQIIASLNDLVATGDAPGKVLTDPADLDAYGKDWTRMYPPRPLAIVLPKTTEQVQAVVRFANEHGVALVPSGGRTGLSAGAVAANGEVVVAFDLMNRILDFNPSDRTVRCQAGVITEQLQNFAEENGLYYPVDFASAGSSQLGGNLSTNAGGIKVIRYGMSRDWVAGLKVVTGKGDILELNKDLEKNNTGYDLRHLFIGAEGTLGFITEATMKLTRKPDDLTVLVLGLADLSNTMDVLQAYQKKLDLTAYEFFSHQAMQHVLAHGQVQAPFDTEAPFYALLEFEAVSDQVMDDAMALFEQCVEQGWVLDGVISQSETQARNLWQLRERISESIAPRTPYKNDISVVVSRVPGFLREIDQVVTEHYPDFEIIWFGHIGDGNLHLNILKPEDMAKEDFFEKCQQVNQWVFEIVQKYEGSVSAEHGVGMTKKPYLHYTRSEAEIAYLKGIKQVFDPNGIMNPGKIFD